MKYFGYDVIPYTSYKICSDFMSFSRQTLKEMATEDLRKMAISLTDTWVKTEAPDSSPNRQISLLDSIDENSFISRNPEDGTDGHSDFFKQNYEQIMHNESPDWILYEISLWYDRLKFKYCDCSAGGARIKDSERNGTVYIRQDNFPKDVHFIANVPSVDDSKNEKYEVSFWCDDWRLSNGSYGSYFSIWESARKGVERGRRLRFLHEQGRYVCRIDE